MVGDAHQPPQRRTQKKEADPKLNVLYICSRAELKREIAEKVKRSGAGTTLGPFGEKKTNAGRIV